MTPAFKVFEELESKNEFINKMKENYRDLVIDKKIRGKDLGEYREMLKDFRKLYFISLLNLKSSW